MLLGILDGTVQLVDTRIGSLLHTFKGHTGPVRAVDLHPTQPLAASGGDDTQLRVWSTKEKKEEFVLDGHIDYIRRVQFHKGRPWLLSCSDDQTIKIWNWQSRQCISLISGHNHYIMSASFHPSQNLLVSTSLDQTIRIWDTSALAAKNVSIFGSGAKEIGLRSQVFGSSDVVARFVLDDHTHGVTWAEFHSKRPLLVSCGQDKTIKLWRYMEQNCWLVNETRAHTKNITCVVFDPQSDSILSCSEDGMVKIWDTVQPKSELLFIRREKIWCLAAHPKESLFAIGHDEGVVLFRIGTNRPAYTISGDNILYVSGGKLRVYGVRDGTDLTAMSIGHSDIRVTSISVTGDYMYIQSGDTYEVINLKSGGSIKTGTSEMGTFIDKRRFVVLEKSGHFVLKSVENTKIKKFKPLHATYTRMWYSGPGSLLLGNDRKVAIFNFSTRKFQEEIEEVSIKRVSWTRDMKNIALMSKNKVILCDRRLNMISSVKENVKIKSGGWGEGVFIYATSSHIKYLLLSGENNVIKVTEGPLYIARVMKNSIFVVTKERKVEIFGIDSSEFRLKIAIEKGRIMEAMKIAKMAKFPGRSVLQYLRRKGQSRLALLFAEESIDRFELALESGELKEAEKMAKKLGIEEWKRLGEVAISRGEVEIAEKSFQKTKNFERLSFLYLIIGDLEKLGKMGKIAKMRDDGMSRYHNSMYLGNKEERRQLLTETGRDEVGELDESVHPPKVLLKMGDWPKIFEEDSQQIIEEISEKIEKKEEEEKLDINIGGWGEGWGEEELKFEPEEEKISKILTGGEGEKEKGFGELGGGWGDLEEEGWPEEELKEDFENLKIKKIPERWIGIKERTINESNIAGEHVASGSWDTAFTILNTQIGVTEIKKFKKVFRKVYLSSRGYFKVYSGLPLRKTIFGEKRTMVKLKLPNILEIIKLVTAGKFEETIKQLKNLFEIIPLLSVTTGTLSKVLKSIETGREYSIMAKMMIEIRKLKPNSKENPKRFLELWTRITHCNIEPKHLLIVLRYAMVALSNMGNHKTARIFAGRVKTLAQGLPNSERFIENAEKVIKRSRNLNDKITLNYDHLNPFRICAKSFEPIIRGENREKCPYCNAEYKIEFKGEICNICKVSKIGNQNVIGLIVSQNQK